MQLQADIIIAYGEKLRLPEEPLDLNEVKAHLQVGEEGPEDMDSSRAADTESIEKLVSLASHCDLPQDTPFQSFRELASQAEVDYIEKCAQWSVVQILGCRAVLAARHLRESSGAAQEVWPPVAKDVLEKVSGFYSALSIAGECEGEDGSEDLMRVKCEYLLKPVAEQPPWDSIVQGTVAATAEYRTGYRQVFSICASAVLSECNK